MHAVPRRHGLDVARDGAHGGGQGEIAAIETLEKVTRQIGGHTICALGDAAAWPILGLIRHFRPVMEERIASYRTRTPMRMAAE